jgi:hypothetical protein
MHVAQVQSAVQGCPSALLGYWDHKGKQAFQDKKSWKNDDSNIDKYLVAEMYVGTHVKEIRRRAATVVGRCDVQ